MTNIIRYLLVLASVVCASFSVSSIADEVILDDQKFEDIFVGDFSCSPGQYRSGDMFKINPGKQGINTGELWTYFKSRGINRMDRLIICMDIDPARETADVDVQQVELTIKDPFGGSTLTSYSLDRDRDNSLIVPAYEASYYRPEAMMKINLGFDFMERFSESSTQEIFFDVKMDEQGTANSSFYITSTDDSLVALPSILVLGLFVAFWVAVFAILFLLTNPAARSKSKNAVST